MSIAIVVGANGGIGAAVARRLGLCRALDAPRRTFVASPSASFGTGVALPVDGGKTAAA
ncbi:hypothetical protein [Acrocarpospora sp. B8E8]|uniref:hypothetical protein n=1 Tax=Acrocarpospora sp. B8E8 TaxID=3153572 RepID=UPI00325F8C96